MYQKYPYLFSPLRLGNITVKNRIFTAPMGVSDLTPEGYLTPQNIAVYRQKAMAGAGVVSLGEALVDQDRGKAHGRMIPLDDVEILPSLIDCTDAVKRYGAYTSIELIHAGARARPEYCRKGPVGPSEHMGIYGEMVKEITEEQIEEIVEKFGQAAFMAKCGGIDICTIHGSHGWIFSQFMARNMNQRTDRFGGSIENRARFALLVIERIRAYCGEDYPIEFRISGSDLYEGGVTIEESIEYAKILDEKIDLLHVSAGSFHVPDTSTRMFPSMYLPEGVNVPFAEAIRPYVKVPIATVGALGNDAQFMEDLIAQDKVDVINLARATVADGDIVNKIRRGEEDEVTTCLRCNMCLSLSFVPHVPFAVRVMRCSVNPMVGFEFETQLMPKKTDSPKRVLVAGGGPAGMQAALTAAQRGHQVILCEKSDVLGGLLVSADHIPFKDSMRKYKDSLIARLKKAPIKVRMNTPVTPELVAEIAPDTLFVAIGGDPIVPNIPGIEGDNVYFAAKDFGEHPEIGEQVVIVGGGLVGCEESIYYARQGKKVTLIETTETLAKGAWYLHLRATLNEMELAGVTSLTETTCTKITPEGVYGKDKKGKELFLPADAVIIAVGMTPKTQEMEALRDTAFDFREIGDCREIKTITEAVRTGYDAALSLG